MHFHSLSTGKLILTILAEEPGINAKQIYYRILRQGGKAISYQAVHKKIAAFEVEGIISKKSHHFSISDSWLNEITSLVETARNKSLQTQNDISEDLPIHQMRTHYESKYKENHGIKEPFY